MMLVITCVALVLFAPYLASRILSSSRCVSIIARPGITGTATGSEHALPDRLRIATFNMAHGRGLVASNWDGGSFEVRMDRLDEIAAVLDSLNADVVVLNEVDFNCSWSHGVNQAQYLGEAAGYPYRVEQRNFDTQIAWWSWRCGNAVLSRVPIRASRVIDMPDDAWWETALAGKKRGIACKLQFADQHIWVIGVHFSSRSESVRVESAECIVDLIGEAQYMPVIVAGDLNASPSGYMLAQQDDAGRNAIDAFDRARLFRRRPDGQQVDETNFTFPSDQPECVIDWILIPSSWEFIEYRVHRSDVSDHRAVLAVIKPGEQQTDEQ
jgi:endonuclease/exonuclease/phosphatase family metal-dependent hydrolase